MSSELWADNLVESFKLSTSSKVARKGFTAWPGKPAPNGFRSPSSNATELYDGIKSSRKWCGSSLSSYLAAVEEVPSSSWLSGGQRASGTEMAREGKPLVRKARALDPQDRPGPGRDHGENGDDNIYNDIDDDDDCKW